MKSLLIIGYVITVLLFSAFARAEVPVTSLPIKEVRYVEGSWLIKVSGDLNNPCLKAPRAVLAPSKKNQRVLNLQIVAESIGDVCAQVVRGQFSLVFDLRSVVSQSGVKIDRGYTYTVRTENYPFEVSFEGRDILNAILQNTVEIKGTLVADQDGRVAVVGDDQKVTVIGTSFIDLEKYLNRTVNVIGLFIPLLGANDKFLMTANGAASAHNLAQPLVVTGISSTAL